MLTLYSATTAISIAVNVPVAGIDVLVEDYIELDLDRGESYEVEYIILPTEAKNKKVHFYFEQIGNEPLATFTVDGNTITPTSAGQAKVVLETDDGGYRDHLNVIVYSRMVKNITSSLVDDDGIISVGEVAKITTVFYPEVASNKGLTYDVIEGKDIVEIPDKYSNEVRGVRPGTAKIEVTSIANPSVKSVFDVTVRIDEPFSFVKNYHSITAAQSTKGAFPIVFDSSLTFKDIQVEVIGQEGVLIASFNSKDSCIEYEFIDVNFVGEIDIRFTATPEGGEPISKNCKINRVKDVSATWPAEKPDDYKVGSNGKDFVIDLNPKGADVTFTAVFEYSEVTDLVGEIHSGEEIVLTAGVTYTMNGGFASITVVNTPDGVYLRVQRTVVPDLEQLAYTEFDIKLTITDNVDQDRPPMELDEISIMVI